MNAVTAGARGLPARALSARAVAIWTWGGLVLLLAVASLLIYLAGHGATFFRDDWNFVLMRRGHSLDTFLRPHNGHAVPLHVLAYKGLLETAGLKSYVPFQALSLALHASVGALLFVFARRRVGAAMALAATAVFAIPGIGGDEVLWPFQIGFLGSLVAGMGMLLALERRDRRGDLIACALLLVSLASSGLGAVLAVAAFVEIVAGGERRQRLTRVLVVPLGLYALWHLVYGGEVPRELLPATELTGYVQPPFKERLFDAPRYVFESAASALAGATGLERAQGAPLALGAATLLGIRLARGGISPRLWALISLLLAYWVLLALARGHGYEAPRYVYPGVLFIVLILLESARGMRPSPRGLALVAGATAFIVLGNMGLLRDQGEGFQRAARDLLPRLTALELARGQVSASFRPAPEAFGTAPDIVAGRYFAAIDNFGSPAPPASELARQSEAKRATADATLLRALAIRAVPTARPAREKRPPQLLGAQGGSARAERGCVVLRPTAARAPVELRLSAPALVVTTRSGGPLELRARRLADSFGAPFATVPGGRRAVLGFPRDRLRRPWELQLGADRVVSACAGKEAG